MNNIIDSYFGNVIVVILILALEFLFVLAFKPSLNRILEPAGQSSQKVLIASRLVAVIVLLVLFFSSALYPPVFFTEVFVYSIPISLALTPAYLKSVSRKIQTRLDLKDLMITLISPQVYSFVAIILLNGILDSSSGTVMEFKVMTRFEAYSRNRDECYARV